MDQLVFWGDSPTTKQPVGLERSIPLFPVECGLLPWGTSFTSAQGKFLTSLGLSKLFLTISLHYSSQFFFPFPLQAQVPKKKKWRSHWPVPSDKCTDEQWYQFVTAFGELRPFQIHFFFINSWFSAADPTSISWAKQHFTAWSDKEARFFRQRINVPVPV